MLSLDAEAGAPADLVLGGALPELAAGLAAWTLHELGRRPGYALPRPARNLGDAQRSGDTLVVPGPPASPGTERVLAPRSALLLAPGPEPRELAAVLDALPSGATVVVDAADAGLVGAVGGRGLRIIGFGVEGDPPLSGEPVPAAWVGASYAYQGGVQPFELFAGGTSCGRVFSPLPGPELVRLAVGTIAWLAERGEGVSAREAASGLRGFEGLGELLEPVGVAAGVTVVRHRDRRPASRRVALSAERSRRPRARLFVIADDPAGLEALPADHLTVPTSRGTAAEVAQPVADRVAANDVVLVMTERDDVTDAVLVALTARGLRSPASAG